MALAGFDVSHLWQQQKLLGSCVVLVGVVLLRQQQKAVMKQRLAHGAQTWLTLDVLPALPEAVGTENADDTRGLVGCQACRFPYGRDAAHVAGSREQMRRRLVPRDGCVGCVWT